MDVNSRRIYESFLVYGQTYPYVLQLAYNFIAGFSRSICSNTDDYKTRATARDKESGKHLPQNRKTQKFTCRTTVLCSDRRFPYVFSDFVWFSDISDSHREEKPSTSKIAINRTIKGCAYRLILGGRTVNEQYQQYNNRTPFCNNPSPPSWWTSLMGQRFGKEKTHLRNSCVISFRDESIVWRRRLLFNRACDVNKPYTMRASAHSEMARQYYCSQDEPPRVTYMENCVVPTDVRLSDDRIKFIKKTSKSCQLLYS